ncbi:hypothetical protein [Pseudosulfitobacter pseudonitzschiae]|uniref:hypothetical protein n=1 Tax=Pseudosulfitobacter pseudonitzschiae TaxID=1402135 RepID=UPI003B7FF86E
METLILDIAKNSGVAFRLGDVTAPAVSALRSPQVAQGILDLSTSSLNSAAPAIFDSIDIMESELLMGCLVDYAIEVAPRVEGSDDTIDVSKLGAHVTFMKSVFGTSLLPHDLITRIGQRAQLQINLDELQSKPSPHNHDQDH